MSLTAEQKARADAKTAEWQAIIDESHALHAGEGEDHLHRMIGGMASRIQELRQQNLDLIRALSPTAKSRLRL